MSVDGFDARDSRDVVPEVVLDAHLEGHAAGGAPDTGAVEADSDDAPWGDIDELDISAIGLDAGAHEIDDATNLVDGVGGQGRGGFGGLVGARGHRGW